jgi:sialic acid synthase SpsE/mannose-6-phosphate isomerase-like protein (cupin superfamily)
MTGFDFSNLFIFDLANNHQGDVQHGVNIINAVGEVVRKNEIKATLKFQFRQLETFIHPDYRDKKDVKHIGRFTSTRLERKDFEKLTEAVQKAGMITMCTPFDEESVQPILDMGIELIKIGSCSANDWPLLERVAQTNRPVVVSTAGLNLNQIDKLVSFLKDRRVDFALMHCVAIYPTPTHQLRLNQIGLLKSRYPDVPIGFSTHEDQDDVNPIQMAYAKGAQLFERHVGLNTEKHKLNNYSSTPEQLDRWIASYKKAMAACGGDQPCPGPIEESESLKSLMRGVFAKRPLKRGIPISREDVFFAMPLLEGQLSTSLWHEGMIADSDYNESAPLSTHLAELEPTKDELVYRIMLQVMGMLNNARVSIGKSSSVEISHHYGLERFREFGAVIVNCINRTYCKKLVVQLPRQKHPFHMHRKKEETFQLLAGDLEVVVDGKLSKLKPGDTLLVGPNQWHKFNTLAGAIFEEVSTTHYNDDSIYEDEAINRMARDQRKTIIPNWEAAMKPTMNLKEVGAQAPLKGGFSISGSLARPERTIDSAISQSDS